MELIFKHCRGDLFINMGAELSGVLKMTSELKSLFLSPGMAFPFSLSLSLVSSWLNLNREVCNPKPCLSFTLMCQEGKHLPIAAGKVWIAAHLGGKGKKDPRGSWQQ